MINPLDYTLPKHYRKTACPNPNCHDRHCYKPYVHKLTGEVLHPDVGRCDHEQSCQYHYSPKMFLRDHPELRYSAEAYRLSSVPSKAAHYGLNAPPEPQSEFYPMQWVEQAQKRHSTFRWWFESLPYEAEVKQQVLRDYLVGGTQWDAYVDHVNYGPAVVFWMIDEQLRPHDAKLMAYKADGHRVQGWGDSIRAICERKHIGPQLEQTDKCFFGLHLLPRYPDRPVALVESEKTALMCACHYPQYLWMATSGCGGLNAQKLRPLMQSHLVIFPDSGEYNKWLNIMKATHHPRYTISDMLEQYPPNTDLADVLLSPPNAHIE